jgi:hypothetical protein
MSFVAAKIIIGMPDSAERDRSPTLRMMKTRRAEPFITGPGRGAAPRQR